MIIQPEQSLDQFVAVRLNLVEHRIEITLGGEDEVSSQVPIGAMEAKLIAICLADMAHKLAQRTD